MFEEKQRRHREADEKEDSPAAVRFCYIYYLSPSNKLQGRAGKVQDTPIKPLKLANAAKSKGPKKAAAASSPSKRPATRGRRTANK